jgi:hypothetical protein
MRKMLDIKIGKTKDLRLRRSASADRRGLGHDRANYFAGQGWMSQGG